MHIYENVDQIYSDEEFLNGVSTVNRDQQVVLIREGGGIRFYTVADRLGKFEAVLYLSGVQVVTIKHELTREEGFDRMIAAAEKFIAGDNPLPINLDHVEPPPQHPAPQVPPLGDDQRQSLLNSCPLEVLAEFHLQSTSPSAPLLSSVWTDDDEFQYFVQRAFEEATEAQWPAFAAILTAANYDLDEGLGLGQPAFNWQPGPPPVTRVPIDMPNHIRNRGLVARALMYWVKRLITAHVATGEGTIFGV